MSPLSPNFFILLSIFYILLFIFVFPFLFSFLFSHFFYLFFSLSFFSLSFFLSLFLFFPCFLYSIVKSARPHANYCELLSLSLCPRSLSLACRSSSRPGAPPRHLLLLAREAAARAPRVHEWRGGGSRGPLLPLPSRHHLLSPAQTMAGAAARAMMGAEARAATRWRRRTASTAARP